MLCAVAQALCGCVRARGDGRGHCTGAHRRGRQARRRGRQAQHHAALRRWVRTQQPAITAQRVIAAIADVFVRSYGRPEYVAMLLDAGADVAARNDTGKTPLDLVKLNSANPVNREEEIMKRLGGGSFFADV